VRGTLALPPEVPPDPRRSALAPAAVHALIACPVCANHADVAAGACPHCGFPFSCDITAADPRPQQRRMATWRVVLGVMALVFLLTGGLFYKDGQTAYYGNTLDSLARLQPDTASGIPLHGPEGYLQRTELALGLLKARAPDFYWRLQQNVQRIDYLSPEELNSPAGRSVRMEGIGAISTPAERLVQVMPFTVFPDGEGVSDRAVYNYAAVLVHELRHIELHWSRQATGGWQEEVLCEQAALGFLEQAGAPPGLIADKEAYLADPQAKRYQGWYDWYKQFE
jgi:hypothetical protein